MKRSGYEIDDIQTCIYQLLKAKATSPWTAWDYIRGWPEGLVFETFTKPFIYVMAPTLVGSWPQQGGLPGSIWNMIIGAWDDRKTGGPEEIQIITSQLLNLFRDRQASHYTATFTCALGSTTYTSKNLIYHEIAIIRAVGPREIVTEDEKEFRNEITLEIVT